MDDDKFTEGRRHVRSAQQKVSTRRWAGAVQFTEGRTVIELYTEPTYDGHGTMTLGEWGGWLVQIMPMIYNDRLVLTPKKALGAPDYGWCFDKGAAAMLAALTWDPDRDGEPYGYTHRVPGKVRTAGEHAAQWQDL